jgi:hypothetical protein
VAVKGGGGTVQQFFQAAARGLRDHHATASQGTDAVTATGLQYVHATPESFRMSLHPHITAGSLSSSSSSIAASSSTSYYSAMAMARQSSTVQAGYLQKLGANIPEYKRRFFVLRPESILYYFLSPHDNEPRGKVDLEGSRIVVLGTGSGEDTIPTETATAATIGSDATLLSIQDDGRLTMLMNGNNNNTNNSNNNNEQSAKERTENVNGGIFRFAIIWDDGNHSTGDSKGDQGTEISQGGGGDFHLTTTTGLGLTTNNINNNNYHNQISQPQYLHYRPQRRIVLEARSREIGLEWIRRLKEDRVSSLKEKVETLTSDNTAHRNRIVDLERQIEHFRMVEKDRDGALEDAKNWRKKFERLDEALRLLTQQIRKPPSLSTVLAPAMSTTATTSSTNNTTSRQEDSGDKFKEVIDEDGHFEDEKKEDSAQARQEEKKEDDEDSEPQRKAISEGSAVNISTGTDQTPTHSNRADNLLDVWTQEDNMDVEEILDVPGTYFSALSNACCQQRESLRLASIEASTAVEDVMEATERVEAIQKRMAKAEKHLLKLWEENCSIRKTMKQKKREKRVLVREVKLLQHTVNEFSQQGQTSKALPPSKYMDDDGQMADTIIGSDDERLIVELEEHVKSSIRLHERLLAGTDFDFGTEADLNTSIDISLSTHPTSVTADAKDNEMEMRIRRDLNSTFSQFENGVGGVNDGLQVSQEPKLLSLFDDDSESENSTTDKSGGASDEDNDFHMDERHSIAPSLSTTGAELGEHDLQRVDSITSVTPINSMVSVGTGGSTPERQNPLHHLDDDDEDDSSRDMNDNGREKPRYPATTLVTFSSKSVQQNGQATSRLVCPLADVVETRSSTRTSDHNPHEEFQVYHVTFYSQRIGIQFQKAPPAPTKPRGLLTDAMTADLVLESNGSDKTAAELRSVASIASLAQGGHSGHGKEYCPLALPQDIVLACGFQGFNDSGTNQRPKLGARLVAFDGISVEIGKWTFDSIRKAIKARGRPLTLSFRNDFLTTEQRAVLTKAVMEVDAKRPPPPPRPIIQYERPPSTTPSVNSALSHETDHFVNSGNSTHQSTHIVTQTYYHTGHRVNATDNEAGLDISGRATADSNCWERCPPSVSSTTSSLSSNHRTGDDHQPAIRRLSSASLSTHKTTGSNFRSFSEAGSSTSVISSALAPLMANLLKGVSPSEHRSDQRGNWKTRIEPDYLHREPTRLDSTPQHQDYQSNLL